MVKTALYIGSFFFLSSLVSFAETQRVNEELLGVDVTAYWAGASPASERERFRDIMANDFSNLGVRWMRMNFRKEDGSDTLNWIAYDNIVSRALSRDIAILGLICYDGKQWSTKADWNTESWQNDFSNRVAEIVNKYSNRIHIWEIWNEPIRLGEMPPADFARLHTRCYQAIKAIDPTAHVIGFALEWPYYDATNYLEQAYASSTFQNYYATHGHYPVDSISIHPYAFEYNPDDYLAEQIGKVRTWMNNWGETHKRIWLTELGWSNTDGELGIDKGSQIANDYYQGIYLTRAYQTLQTLTDPTHPELGPYVEKMFWFAYEDNPFEVPNLGLRTFAWTPTSSLGTQKTSYTAYRDLANNAYINLAEDGYVSASSGVPILYGSPNRINDQNTFSLWQATNTGNSYVTLDLGAQKRIHGYSLSYAQMAGFSADYNTRTARIETASSSSGPWTTHYSIYNPNGYAVSTLTSAPPVDARYVKCTVMQSNNGIDPIARIAEWQIWGDSVPHITDPIVTDSFNTTWIDTYRWDHDDNFTTEELSRIYEDDGVLRMKSPDAWGYRILRTIKNDISNYELRAKLTIVDSSMAGGGNDQAHCGVAFNCNGAEYHLNFFAHDGAPDTPNIRLRKNDGSWSTVGNCRTNVTISNGDSFGIRITSGTPTADSLHIEVGRWPSYSNLLDWQGTDSWSTSGAVQCENWQLAESSFDFVEIVPAIPEPVTTSCLGTLFLLQMCRFYAAK